MNFFSKNQKLKILFVTTEETPFAKVGGLGEVMFSLPRALNELGHDVRVMIPRYGTIGVRENGFHFTLIREDLEVPTAPRWGGKRLICNVWKYEKSANPQSPVTTYFLENQEYYELRSNVYGYKDDHIRFALFSRGALEFLNGLENWLPEVIVTTDWMTGFLPNFLKTDYQDFIRLKNIATVFSIHNLESRPLAQPDPRFASELGRDDGHGPLPDFFSERMANINATRRGIMHADIINTVSPTYAREIMTEEFGEGLDGLLRERRERVYGILNGLDLKATDPASDPALKENFTSKTLERREENKLALQKRFNLNQGKNIFVMGIVSRLWRQKGFDLLEPFLEKFLRITASQLVVVGAGDAELMEFFHNLGEKFPNQAGVHLQFDEILPHLVYAGADVILIPSRFEPSGLIQMEAMRFGAVPVARSTGGLADTVEESNPETGTGNGFLFGEADPVSFSIALSRAYESWRHKATWQKLQKTAMEKDLSWLRSAREYEKLFQLAIKFRSLD